MSGQRIWPGRQVDSFGEKAEHGPSSPAKTTTTDAHANHNLLDVLLTWDLIARNKGTREIEYVVAHAEWERLDATVQP